MTTTENITIENTDNTETAGKKKRFTVIGTVMNVGLLAAAGLVFANLVTMNAHFDKESLEADAHYALTQALHYESDMNPETEAEDASAPSWSSVSGPRNTQVFESDGCITVLVTQGDDTLTRTAGGC